MSAPDYQQVLEEHLDQIEREMAERRRGAVPGDERPGFGKRAGDYVAQVVEDRTNNQLVDSLDLTAAAIRRALALIDDGGYGLCASCREPIAEDRLQAVPWASLCMRCQSTQEHRRPLSTRSPPAP